MGLLGGLVRDDDSGWWTLEFHWFGTNGKSLSGTILLFLSGLSFFFVFRISLLLSSPPPFFPCSFDLRFENFYLLFLFHNLFLSVRATVWLWVYVLILHNWVPFFFLPQMEGTNQEFWAAVDLFTYV